MPNGTQGEGSRDRHGGTAEGRASDRGTAEARPRPPPLPPNIRRHLGLALRTVYAAAPAEPMGERIESLLGRLGNLPPDKGLPGEPPP